ncbi:hypothetical protein BDW59DRAFT_99453 [Aspergillus cavernicola]|uniref:Endo-1,3(4)-beta-glucanase n=1 Tax=Aspergillus cavernicola TaxID=176166 RepID=A0ABR4I6D9_9EURO
MALDDAWPQSPDSFRLDPKLNADDSIYIKPDLIKRPDLITLYVGYWGPRNWHRQLSRSLSEVLEASRIVVKRPATQSELDFYVETISRTQYLYTSGTPVGLAAGILHATVLSRHRKAFNIYAPQTEGMSPAKRLFQGVKTMYKMDPSFARAATVSFFAKIIFWWGGVSVLSGLASGMLALQRRETDPRMQQYRAELSEQDPDEVRKRHIQAVNDKVRARNILLKQRRGESVPQGETSEQTGYGGSSSSTGSWTQSADTSASPTAGNRAYDPSAPPDNQSKGGSFLDDDASPTAPEYRGTGSQENPATQGSVWDQIRRGNQPQSSSQSYPAPGKGSRDSSSSSDATSDSQAERDQAQTEFDRMLEAERNRSSDSEASPKRTGWWK